MLVAWILKFKSISNETLVNQLKNLVMDERKTLTSILWHLAEAEARKIHLLQGYPSVFEYCVQVLGYSSSQAYRRISAMRLLREVPQMEASLESGKLNLTHLTLAQEYFKAEKKLGAPVTETDKLKLLSCLENKTTREAEKIMHTLSPELILKEKERVITNELTEIRFIANEALLQKLKRFKEIDSHVQVNPNYAELFERLVDLALKQKDPELKPKRISEKTLNRGKTDQGNLKFESIFSAPKKEVAVILKNDQPSSSAKSLGSACISVSAGVKSSPSPHAGARPGTSTPHQNPRFIPAHIKVAVFKRDHGACVYQNVNTGKQCGSTFQIQFDHVVPVAKGGESRIENLRILCASHNRLEAERVFGKEKMGQFLKGQFLKGQFHKKNANFFGAAEKCTPN